MISQEQLTALSQPSFAMVTVQHINIPKLKKEAYEVVRELGLAL